MRYSRRKFFLLSAIVALLPMAFSASRFLRAKPISIRSATNHAEPATTSPHSQPVVEPAAAQVIDRNVIAGGGGSSVGGSFKLEGTIGEVSASKPMSGGSITLSGGMWNALDFGAAGTPTPTPTPNPTPTPTPTPTPSAPYIIIEEGTVNRAVAFDSVTHVRGPFKVLTGYNFSADHHTRVILFTSNLGLTQPDPSLLTVQASGFNLTVENVGVLTGVNGLDGSYVIVRLPDGLPPGDLLLTVTLRGVMSNITTLSISP